MSEEPRRQQNVPVPQLMASFSLDEFINPKLPFDYIKDFQELINSPDFVMSTINEQTYAIALMELDVIFLEFIMASPPSDSDWSCGIDGRKKLTNEDIRELTLLKHHARFRYRRSIDGHTSKLLVSQIHVSRQEGIPAQIVPQRGFFNRISGRIAPVQPQEVIR